jgi:hypothetical protein
MTDELPRDDAADSSAPSADGSSPVSAVGALMEERRRYEAWLAALEARRAETPKHVFTRVHADYTSRLESVIERLVAHTDGLRAELTTLTTRIASLDEQQHRARDERAEAELRAHVGELTENAWKETLAASDALIASLAAQHAAAEEDLRRTRELLADAERPPTPVPPPAQVKSVAAQKVAADGIASENGTAANSASLPDTAMGGAHVPDAAPAAAAERNAPDGPTPNRETTQPAPARPEERIQKQGENVAPLIQPKPGGRGSLAANISGNNPIVLKDKPNESAKTLKCGECGAMNYQEPESQEGRNVRRSETAKVRERAL